MTRGNERVDRAINSQAGRRPPAGTRGHGEPIAVDGEAQPVTVKLGVRVSNTKSRRDKLAAEQLDALRELGVDWA